MARLGDFQVTGVEKLNRELERLPYRIQKNVSAVALRKGARLIVKAARAKVPVLSGNLKKSLGSKMERVLRGEMPVIQIGARRKIRGAKHAHLVEFGHGGPKAARPYPFLEPAIRETSGAALKAIRDELSAWLKLVRFR